MDRKVCLITGGNAGIVKEAAVQIAGTYQYLVLSPEL